MSQKRTEELVGGAMKTSVEGVDARGNRIAYQFAVPADGKDHPVTGVGMPYGSDTIAMIVLDWSTLDATFKKGGTVMGTAHAVMSKDGRTLTVTSKSQANGQTTNNVTVWEKGDGGNEVRSRYCTLILANRACTMVSGCCQVAKLLFNVRIALELNAL